MGYDVIGRALKAGVLTEAERSQAARRCMDDPGFEQRLEEQIAAKGTATSAKLGRPAGAAATPSGPAAEMLRAWTGGDSTLREVLASGVPVPTLFASGDLPAQTSSGMDPARLAAAPWWTRPAIAEARTLAEAEELLAAAVDDPDVLEVSDRVFSRAVGYVDFETGLRAAAMSATRAKVDRDADAQISAARQARVSASPAKPPRQMSDDELYAAAFGAVDQHRDQVEASRRGGGTELRNHWDGSARR